MIGPHHLNPNHTAPLYATVPLAEYQALQKKLDICQKECIRIAELCRNEKHERKTLENEIENLLNRITSTEKETK